MWLLPAEGPSPLCVPSLAAQVGVLPLSHLPPLFRQKYFGIRIVLYEALQHWYLQQLKACGVPLVVGTCCVHPWELLWGDGWGGRRGKVMALQGQH